MSFAGCYSDAERSNVTATVGSIEPGQHSEASVCAPSLAFSMVLSTLALSPRQAAGNGRVVADEVIFDNEPKEGLVYEHIYYEPNVCIYGGFNCAIIVFDPDPIHPNGWTVAHVLTP